MRTVIKVFLFLFLGLTGKQLSHTAFAQNQNQKQNIYRDTCEQFYQAIYNEYNQGHFFAMDSLYRKYLNSTCFQAGKRKYDDILRILITQRLEDGYRVNEADSLQSILDGLSHYPVVPMEHSESCRIGFSQTIIWSNMGKTGWSAGLTIARNFHTVKNRNRGFETGIFYQRLPFSFSEISNKDKNNIYKPEGFILESNGYSTVINVPVKVYVDLITTSRQTRIGVGLFGGAELSYLQKTFINHYYYENQYTESYDPVNDLHYLTYKTEQKSGYEENDFFKNRMLVNLLFGINGYYRISEKWLVTASPTCSFMISGKLKVDGVDYSKQFNYFGIRVTIFYLFTRKQE
jgi:hypothetical protein